MVAVRIAGRSEFYPCGEIDVPVESQRAFYELMMSALRAVRDDVSLLFASVHADDFFTRRFNHASDGKPKLISLMTSALKAIDALVASFCEVMAQGRLEGDMLFAPKALKVKKQHFAVMEALGIPCSVVGADYCLRLSGVKAAVPAWKYMASAGLERFSRCAFDEKHSHVDGVFARELGDPEAFGLLTDYFARKGYERVEMRGGNFALDFAKEYAPKPSPLKDAWAERTHGGVEMRFRELDAPPQYISLRLPYAKDVLLSAGEMSEELRAFLVKSIKKCDGCRYCVQTDKTGARPLARVAVDVDGETRALCPLFPGYSLCWTKLDAELANMMIKLFEFFDAKFYIKG